MLLFRNSTRATGSIRVSVAIFRPTSASSYRLATSTNWHATVHSASRVVECTSFLRLFIAQRYKKPSIEVAPTTLATVSSCDLEL